METANKVTWLIENFTKEPSYTELAAAVKAAECPLIEFKDGYKRSDIAALWVGEFNNYPIHCVVSNGSIEMVKLLRKDLPRTCFPIAYCNFDSYLCSNYYSHFGDLLFNDKYVMMPLKEVKRQKFMIYGLLGKDGLVFIRPDSGEKTFQAQLVDILDIDRFADGLGNIANDLVVISTPKNIKWEGRFVVNCWDDIIAHSTYRFQGQKTLIPSVPRKSLDICREVMNKSYVPDSVYCIDLCEGDDGKFYLLELTSFSSAGLYGSDKNRIVAAVNEVALEDFKRHTLRVCV